jgi:PAS domain S-box-containing protein
MPFGVGAPDGRLLMFNQAFVDLTGYSREELIQKQMTWATDLTPPEWREYEVARLAEAIRTHQPVRYEKEYHRKDGTDVPIELFVQPVFDTAGNLLHYRSFLTDITERKHAEEALRESRAKLDAALDSMTDAVFISDTQGNFIDFNNAFATFHKFKNKDECAKTLAEYPEFLDVFMADGTLAPLDMWAVPRALRGEVVNDAEYTLRRKDTGETWVGSYNFAPIRDKDGTIVGSVVVGRDITKRKQAEEEREQLLGAIQQEKEWLAALINSITDEVWFADTQKNLTLINSSALCEFSICAEEKFEVEKLVASLEVYRPDGSLRPLEEAPSLYALQGEVVKNQEEIVRTPVYGELRYRQVSAAPVHDTCGNIIGAVSIVRDITESKKAEEKIQVLANIVESSDDAIVTSTSIPY